MTCTRNSRGVALIVTLGVLLVVSLMGVGALRLSVSQSKVSMNSRLDTLSFQAAESGIRAVLREALASNITSPDNVIGATLNLGVCTTAHSISTSCVVFRCVTQADPSVAGQCASTASLDGAGNLRAESRTRHTGQFNVVNSSVNAFRDYAFETESHGCLLDSVNCSSTHWSANVQEFKKIAPADPTANFD